MEKIMLDIVCMISLGYKNENKFRNTAQIQNCFVEFSLEFSF